MGLAPAVCQHCQVVADHQYLNEHPFYRIWCRYCGETNITDSAGLGDDRWQQLSKNKIELDKIYNFLKGIDSDTTNTNNGSSGLR